MREEKERGKKKIAIEGRRVSCSVLRQSMQRGGGGYLGHCGSTWGVLRLSTAGGAGGTLLFLVGVLVESLGGGGGNFSFIIV